MSSDDDRDRASGAMGWQDRDYAKWTPAERRSFFGSGAVRAGRPPAVRTGFVRPGARLAILASAALVALGQFPQGHPILPALHISLPGSHSASPGIPAGAVGTINLPGTASVGSTLTLHGTAPLGNGPVTVEGSYDAGQSWETLANVGSANGTYVAQIALSQSGPLQIRVVFANGSEAVGSMTVG